MIKLYRILVLTDHRGHSDQNSIYAILRQLSLDARCQSIDVASRGIEDNNAFFEKQNVDELFGTKIKSDFRYTKDGRFFKHDLHRLNIEDYDIVFLRIPRPISDDFLKWIDEVFEHATIINKPSGIIATSNKQYLLNFPTLCPDMRLCHSIEDIKSEMDKYAIVLKPLKEYGGRGILKINGEKLDDGNAIHNTFEYLKGIEETIEKEGYLSMKYLKNIKEGDKRILVAGGEVLAASLRLPAEGSWLCNVAQGGTSTATDITQDEFEIIQHINPHLVSKGILIYGADTLVDDDGKRILSEVNTLSIGGFPQAEAQTGKPIIKLLIDKIFEHAD